MTSTPRPDDPIEAVAALAEPTRRALYDHVAPAPRAVGRDDAAAASGISRELAAFHLDRLVDAGLLADRIPPAQRADRSWRRTPRQALSPRRTRLRGLAPARHYERAADLMATALQRLPDGVGDRDGRRTARERGASIGTRARRRPGRRLGRTPGAGGAPRGPARRRL